MTRIQTTDPVERGGTLSELLDASAAEGFMATHARIPDRSPLELFIGGRNIADRTKARLMALNPPSAAPTSDPHTKPRGATTAPASTYWDR